MNGNHLTREYLTSLVPPEVWLAAQWAYYGGWFEITCHGHIPGDSYEYDINSAYPWAISRLPCLAHGSWIRSSMDGSYQNEGASSLRLLHCSLLGRSRYLGAALHRTGNGNISRPLRTKGWFWDHEIRAGYEAALIDDIEVSECWEYVDRCGEKPLAKIAELYQYRLSIGKNTLAGKAAKLVFNSAYGKFAQSVGHPKYGNSIYASLITSMCRTQILDAIASLKPMMNTSHGPTTGKTEPSAAVLMIATDAVYFTIPHPCLPVSDSLGSWDTKRRSNLTLFKPGVYWDDSTRERIAAGADPVFKSRGVSARDFSAAIGSIDRQFSEWDSVSGSDNLSGLPWPSVSFGLGFSMVSARQAIARGKWGTAGQVVSDNPAHKVTQSSDPVSKRRGLYRDGRLYRSSPWPDMAFGSGDYASTPYDRRFGQTDPDAYGITDDGTVIDTIAAALIG